MLYLDHLKEKLKINDNDAIIETAVNFIARDQPTKNPNLIEHQIIDEWFSEIFLRWNIETRVLNLSQSHFLGKLEPKLNGFILNLNKNLFPTQKRFVIAHELAHLLSFDVGKTWPLSSIIHSKQEEYYCDRIARALLLPSSLIDLRSIDIINFTAENMTVLKSTIKKFEISGWQVIKKILEDQKEKSVIGICWKYKNSADNQSHLKIIDFHSQSGIFIPRNDRIFIEQSKKTEASYRKRKFHLTSSSKNTENSKPNMAPLSSFKSRDIYRGFDLVSLGSLYNKELLTTSIYHETSAGIYVFQIIKLDS